MCVCVCVSVSASESTNSYNGVMCTPSDWLNKFYSFCMAAIVDIVNRCGLRNEVRHRNRSNKSTLALYKLLLHFYSHLKQLYMVTVKQANDSVHRST